MTPPPAEGAGSPAVKKRPWKKTRPAVPTDEVNSKLKRWARDERKAVHRRTLAGAGVLAIGTALFPAVAAAGEYLWSLPAAGHVALGVLGAGALAVVNRRKGVFSTLREWSLEASLARVIALTCAAVFTTVAALSLGGWWLIGAPPLTLPDALGPSNAVTLVLRAVGVVGVLALVATGVIGYRRQHTGEIQSRIAEEQEDRAKQQTWNENFRSAAEMLSHEHLAQRDAGVYLLASLVDTAPNDDQAQVAVNVLCARLRQWFDPSPPLLPETDDDTGYEERLQQHAEEMQFRETVMRVLRDRLRENERWQNLDFDFTNATFSGFDLHSTKIRGSISFRDAVFTNGTCFFANCQIEGLINFSGASFPGSSVSFSDSTIEGGKVVFRDTQFENSQLDFSGIKFQSGQITLIKADLRKATVNLRNAEFFSRSRLAFELSKLAEVEVDGMSLRLSGGSLGFVKCPINESSFAFTPTFLTDGYLGFYNCDMKECESNFNISVAAGADFGYTMCKISGGQFSFRGVRIKSGRLGMNSDFSGARVDFPGFIIEGGEIDFSQSTLDDTVVSFSKVRTVDGGSVDFTNSTGREPEGLDVIRGITTAYGNWQTEGEEQPPAPTGAP